MSSADRPVPTTTLTNPFTDPTEGYCELLFVRHGEQAYRENMPLAEGVDAPLSDLGRTQARAVGERLSEHRIDAVYASPYQRAFDTGTAIASHHSIGPVVDDRLKEVDLWGNLPQDKGMLDALPRDELRAIFKNVQRMRNWDAYPHGEGSESFRSRIVAAVDEIVAANIGKRVVVACHGGVIGTLLAIILQSPFDTTASVHHSSITTIRAADERRIIHAVNDYSHVLGFQTELNPLNLH